MKKTLCTIALTGLLGLGMTAFAQDSTTQQPATEAMHGPRGQGFSPDKQLEHMTKALNLTSDQQTQIKPILTDRQQKMQALFQDQSLTREDRHSKAQAIQQDTKARLEATLNDQQKQQFEEMQAKMQAHRHQGGDNQAPPSGAVQPQ